MVSNQIIETKAAIQRKALEVWAEKDFKGTLEIATGIGKTRIGVIAGCEFIKRTLHTSKPEKTLIVVPQTNLRDIEWQNEIATWGYYECLPNVTIECINTAYKRKGDEFDTLIVDEIHTALSDEFVKLFLNNKFKRVLGLSATISKEKAEILKNIRIPIIFRYDLTEAEKDGILSDYDAYTLMVDLTSNEMSLYNTISFELKQIGAKLIEKTGIKNTIIAANTILKSNSANGLKGLASKYQKLVYARKQIIFQAENKYHALINLLNRLHKNNTIMVFNESINFIENFVKFAELSNPDIKPVIYHSKMTKKERSAIIDKFLTGEANVLLSAKALNAGFNVPNANVGIVVSGTSSSLDDTQRRGRVLRPQEGKIAVHINFCAKDTVEEGWVAKRSNNKKLIKLNMNQLDTIINRLTI